MTKSLTLVLLLALLLTSMTLAACGGDSDDETAPEATATQPEEMTSEPTEQPTPEDTQQEQPTSGDLSWDDIPIYSGAESESTDECAAKWQECDMCEHRVYMTDASPEDVCSFYEEELPALGWDKLVYQFYPEGSCMGTWMEDMGDSSGPRLFIEVGHPSGNTDTTFVAITMGEGCP